MAPYVTSIPSVNAPPVDTAEARVALAPVKAPANDASDSSRFRLTIEAAGKGRFIYKVLDRVTGEVIRQLPREEVERLSQDPTYSGGRVVNATI